MQLIRLSTTDFLFAVLVEVVFMILSYSELVSATRIMSNNFEVQEIDGTDISDLGEGPHWDSRHSSLYYVDAFVGDVHRYDTELGIDSKINLGDLVTVVIPIQNDDNHLLVSLRNKVVKVNWSLKTFSVIAEVAKEKAEKERFNDGKVDALGRLWIGTVLEGSNGVVKSGGSLYKLEDKQFIKMSDNFTLSNGMAWNNNNTLMYFNDSEERITYVFDYDLQRGTISNKRIFLDFNKETSLFGLNEYPDGMSIDSEDFIWISLYGGARIVRIDSKTGQLVSSIPIPAPKTTSIAFGGPNLSDIYVTTGGAAKNEQDKYPNAGKIFKISSSLTGNRANDFKI